MVLVRLLAVVVIVYGITYVQWGGAQLLGERRGTASIIALNFILGVGILLIGIGLIRAREWARTGWLGAALALLFLHCLWLVVFYSRGNTLGPTNWEIALIFVLAAVSWVYLTKPSVKRLFVGAK